MADNEGEHHEKKRRPQETQSWHGRLARRAAQSSVSAEEADGRALYLLGIIKAGPELGAPVCYWAPRDAHAAVIRGRRI